MNKTTEALKLAEEALEGWKEYDTWTDQQMWNDDDEEALAAIREALAETVKQRHNRCIHPGGPHPQNEFCQWRTPKTEGAME